MPNTAVRNPHGWGSENSVPPMAAEMAHFVRIGANRARFTPPTWAKTSVAGPIGWQGEHMEMPV